MAKKKVVEYEPGKYRNEIYEETTAAKPWGTYRTPEERAAEQRAAAQAANSPAAMRAKEVAEATAQAEALRAADRGTGWSAYRTPEERAAMIRAANNAGKTAESSEPLNPHPLGEVDPIYQTAAGTAAGTPAAGSGTAASGTKQITTDDVLNKILNGDGFRYNLAADPTFQQLAAAARKEAKLEKADTLAHQTAMTGGYGNTWAQAAAERAYDARMQQLYDQVPALEQAAYDRYRDERADLKDQYSILAARDAAANEEAWREREFEYQQYRDKIGDDQWAQEFGLRADAQAWAQHMDELNFTLAEAEYYLKEKVELGQLSLAQAEQALAELKFAHEQKMDYIAADQNQQKINNDAYFDQQKINLDWADLNSHIDGSYYANSGGGGSPSGSEPPDEDEGIPRGNIKTETTEKFSAAVKDVMAFIRHNHTESEIISYVSKYYNSSEILNEALIRLSDKDRARLNKTK